MKGFALVEFIVVITIFASLMLIATISLSTVKQQASLNTSIAILLADLKQQQLKAMVGETEGRSYTDSYGLHFGTADYVLFHGSSYSATDAANLTINLGDSIAVASAPGEIVFSQLSGNATGSAIITLRDSTTSFQKSVIMNKYGVVTDVH